MELIALPAFSDNSIWMLHDGARALVVDPGDAAVVQQTPDARQLELAAILVTHHPVDHVGGVDAAPRAVAAGHRAPLHAGVLYARIDAAQPAPCARGPAARPQDGAVRQGPC